MGGKKGDYIACGLGTEVPEIAALQRRAVATDGNAFHNIERKIHAYNEGKELLITLACPSDAAHCLLGGLVV